jgi:LPXTG-site transpeptidase (sortase) family protein
MRFGNLCIAGHNYANNTHFAKINYLNNGDLIKIYDINGNFLNYVIYDKYEVEYDDMNCTSQDTNGEKEITLITCNTIKGNRIIIKAKEQ